MKHVARGTVLQRHEAAPYSNRSSNISCWLNGYKGQDKKLPVFIEKLGCKKTQKNHHHHQQKGIIKKYTHKKRFKLSEFWELGHK